MKYIGILVFAVGLIYLSSCNHQQKSSKSAEIGNVVIYNSSDTVEVDSIFVAVIGMRDKRIGSCDYYIVSKDGDSSLVMYDGKRRLATFATIPKHPGLFTINGFARYKVNNEVKKEEFTIGFVAK
ncbi:hypothetical protein [uncultured Acetobacteroides sp.]|uniref:hypothetical protein n=1 Tax=uncultured Acetobacteroides sp. TaxID=1760811 RepID=UPI0029F53B32|nr:hypothetical protein [uncultured Acetobacteroides sp.]